MQKIQIAKTILQKKRRRRKSNKKMNKRKGRRIFTLPCFKTYYKAILIKSAMVLA